MKPKHWNSKIILRERDGMVKKAKAYLPQSIYIDFRSVGRGKDLLGHIRQSSTLAFCSPWIDLSHQSMNRSEGLEKYGPVALINEKSDLHSTNIMSSFSFER